MITKNTPEVLIAKEMEKLSKELDALYKLTNLTTREMEIITGFREQMENEFKGIIKKYDDLREELRQKYIQERGMTEIKYLKNEINLIRKKQGSIILTK
jgi:hypothetical protein